MSVPNEPIVPPPPPPPVDTPPRDPDRVPGEEPLPNPEPDEGAAPRGCPTWGLLCRGLRFSRRSGDDQGLA